MTTARDTQPPYQTTASAGGKLRKAPLQRRNILCAPAIRKKNPNLLTKIVDRASKLIRVVFYNRNPSETTREEGKRGNSASISAATGISDLEQVLQQKTFTRSEIERLKALLHSNPYCSPSSLLRLEASTSGSLKKHGDERDNLHAITTPMVTSRVLKEEIASPVELAKAYMGARPSKAALRQDLVLHNNATGFLKSSNTLIAPKIANGFTTPRSRGRSAMYSMARTPYARSPSTFTQKGITSSYGREEALTSSQLSAWRENGIPWKYALITNIMRHVFYVLLSRGDKIGSLCEVAKWGAESRSCVSRSCGEQELWRILCKTPTPEFDKSVEQYGVEDSMQTNSFDIYNLELPTHVFGTGPTTNNYDHRVWTVW
ncbi:hypothetical protein Tco_1428031 [Tanacetum coccineum]